MSTKFKMETNIEAMDKLVMMKLENPQKYKEYMEALQEVSNDLMKITMESFKGMNTSGTSFRRP